MSAHTNSPQNHPENPIWLADRVTLRSLTSLKPYARNSRTHSPKHIEQLKSSVATFGFVAPILIDEAGGSCQKNSA